MKIIDTKFKGLKIIKVNNYKDKRGNLKVTFNEKNINFTNFVFDYCTTTKGKIVRGFHFQSKFPQAKYVTVLKGKVLDCVIDLRKRSKTFGETFKIILSEKNCLSLYIPEGFAHAYYSYDKTNIIYYKLSNFYKPQYEDGVIWNDKTANIKWPIKSPLISSKDRKLGTFSEFVSKYKYL